MNKSSNLSTYEDEDIKETLELLIGRVKSHAGITKDADLARELNVSSSAPPTWRSRGTIPYKELVNFAAREGISLDALFFGGASGDGLYEYTAGDEFEYIPRYIVRVSAGDGSAPELENIADYAAFRRDWLNKRGLDSKSLAMVNIEGDSMEPALNEGESVVVDTNDKKIKGGSAYVIRIGEDLMVKYLERLPGNQVQVSSENPVYKPYIVDLEKVGGEFNVIGKVVNSTRDWR